MNYRNSSNCALRVALSLLLAMTATHLDTKANQSAQTPAGQNVTEQIRPSGATPGRSDFTSNMPAVGGPPSPSSGARGAAPSQQRSQPAVPSGSQIPGAARVTPGVTQLSLQEAIQLAIQNNLSTLLARERRQEARGIRQQFLSPLLPNVSGATYQATMTLNLAALGFEPGTFPGITSAFVGPFNNFDARARLVQSIFDLSAISNYRASRAGVRVAEYEELLAREQVATGTTVLYLETLRTKRSVSAAEANVALAQALLKLAQDQRNAGVATGLDVTRAETRLAEEQVRLAQAQTSAEQAQLNLQRVIGLTLGVTLTLTDPLRFEEESLPAPEVAIAQAVHDRPEVRLAEEQIRVTHLERAAVRVEYLPSLEFVGDYGVSGITATNTDLPTRRAAIQLNVPIFNGGLTRGRLTVATSRERQAELEFSNVRGQVEEDVRLAIVTLRTAAAQVRAAEDSVRLAQRELDMSRDRFSAGVANNLEVIIALTTLAKARDAQTLALAQYNAARANLAAALGHAETFHW